MAEEPFHPVGEIPHSLTDSTLHRISATSSGLFAAVMKKLKSAGIDLAALMHVSRKI